MPYPPPPTNAKPRSGVTVTVGQWLQGLHWDLLYPLRVSHSRATGLGGWMTARVAVESGWVPGFVMSVIVVGVT